LLPQDGRIGKELNRIRGLRQSPDLLLAALRDAVKARPQDIRLLQEYGTSLLRAGRAEEARTTLTQLTELEPDNSLARYHLANALLDVHQPTVAITQLKRILSTDPRFIDAANRLAWILANHPDDKVRVPAEALVLAQRLAQITKNQNPRYLDTLATAHAANGDFKQATEIAEAALAIYAKHSTPAAQTKPLEDRLTSFQAQKPYRESRWLPKP
jgi:predicted Zn-dependent protease